MSGRKEKIEIEEVPLNSDTDPTATNEFDSVPNVDGETAVKKEENCEIGEKQCKKLCRIWHRKSPRSYTLEKEKPKKPKTIVIPDFEHRDEKGLNSHIVMDFGQVFAEPNESHSFNWIWFTANRIFTATSASVYKLLAAFIAIPFAVFFGILFAIFAAISVFLCTPLGVLLGIPLNALSKVWHFFVCKFLEPVTASICCRNRKETARSAPILNA